MKPMTISQLPDCGDHGGPLVRVAAHYEDGTDVTLDLERDPHGLPSDMDAGVAPFVRTLAAAGVETYESCEGGNGHSYCEPTIRFHGTVDEGFRAYGIARRADLPVRGFGRVWDIIEGEITGPHWEMTFFRRAAEGEGEA